MKEPHFIPVHAQKRAVDVHPNVSCGGLVTLIAAAAAAANESRGFDLTQSSCHHDKDLPTLALQTALWEAELGRRLGSTTGWDLNLSATLPDDYFLFSNCLCFPNSLQ